MNAPDRVLDGKTAAIPSDLTVADQLFALDCRPGTVGVAVDSGGVPVAWLRTDVDGDPCVYVTNWDADGPGEMADTIDALSRCGKATVFDRDTLENLGEINIPADVDDIVQTLGAIRDGSVVVAGNITDPEFGGEFVLLSRFGHVWLTASCGASTRMEDLDDCDEADEAGIDPGSDTFFDELKAVLDAAGQKPTARILVGTA